MKKSIFIFIALMTIIGLFSFCGNEPETTTTQLSVSNPPEITLNSPGDFTKIATNVVFSVILSDDDGIQSASIQFDDAEPIIYQNLTNFDFGTTGFKLSTNFSPVSSLKVVISAWDSNDNLASITNQYEVVVPSTSSWTVNLTLYNTGWNISDTSPLTVLIAPRTNTNFSTEAEAWDWSNQLIEAQNTNKLSVTFNNISQNNTGNSDGQYTLVIYRDDNTNQAVDLMNEFPFTFTEEIIDGVNNYTNDFELYLASGRITNSTAIPNSNYIIMVTAGLDEETFEFIGFGGGTVTNEPNRNYFDYELACNQSGTFYIMGAVISDISTDMDMSSMSYAGFYGSSLITIPPLNPNATIRPTGENSGLSFRMTEISDSFNPYD